MAIGFDAASVGANVNAVSGLTWNHTIGSGANRLLVVAFCASANGDGSTLTATYNGVSMTAVGSASISAWSNSLVFFILKEASMPAAGTYAVVLNNVGAFDMADLGGGATSWTGVDQTTAAHNYVQTINHAPDTTPTSVVTSATGEVVVDTGWWVGSGAFTCTFNQTQRWDAHDITNLHKGTTGQSAAGAATVTMSYGTGADGNQWSTQGMSLAAAAGGGGGPTVDQYENAVQSSLLSGGIVGVNHSRT